MNLELLRTFLTVHRTGSFTRAAAALGVSQPTVTAQIRTLERTLGRQLFVRHPGGVSPTGPADHLARQLAPHLDGLAAVVESELRGRAPFEQPVHLGGPAELLAERVLPALAPLVADGLRLRVSAGLPEPLVDGLLAGRHDLVLCTVPPRRRGVAATPLVDEEFLLVGHPDWVDRLPGDVAADGGAALDDVPVVAYAEELPIVRRYWLTVFERRPPMRAAVVVPDLRAVLAVVAAGAGVSVLPDYLVAGALARGELAVLHRPELPPLNTVYLAVRAGALALPHVRAVHERLLAEVGGR
ncbi:LysR family transcriptional regulator [Thermobifida cellulosilytica]|uniref:LysR family transcriptional regulator n=1 Tax=Thermobifida cellulosilytica TB100 TaxID=665004 RepID=A0A147KJI1_THECS|nr:LysR family transcriptional regulator [Thermobifida cellulosilytica]KUP97452.1 LysR family transcriptional regulator [Thermobifida cellulosilytica TB100]